MYLNYNIKCIVTFGIFRCLLEPDVDNTTFRRKLLLPNKVELMTLSPHSLNTFLLGDQIFIVH